MAVPYRTGITKRKPAKELTPKGERWDPLPVELIKPEVYAPGRFVFKQPWYCNAQQTGDYLSPAAANSYSMTVQRLTHCCHVEEALQITQDNTKVKSPSILLGASKNLRQNIMPVMSGYETCFYFGEVGPQPMPLFEPDNQWCFFDIEVTRDNREELLVGCSEDEKEIMMLPTLQSPYLLNYSSQGEMRFSANVRQVLESYVISRGILTGVLFKCGGTLLYSDEIAHMVVVCCRDDPVADFLPDLPSNSPFTPNRLLFTDHEASGSNATVQLNYLKKTGKEGIWDHVVLAFYLPEGQGIVLESGQYQCGITVHSTCSVRPMECPEASNDPFKSISKSRNLGKVIKIITDENDRKKLKKW